MPAATDVMDAYDWIQLLSLGGFVGALGQGVRSIVGIKKLHDATSATTASAYDFMDLSRLFTSLAIGFIAGALAAIGILQEFPKVSSEQVFALAAAGYAGADFIEGLVGRVSGSVGLGAGEDAKGIGSRTRGRAPAPAADPDGTVG